MLRQGADHVEAGGLGLGRRGVGRGALPIGDGEADAFELLLRIEIARPLPAGDRDMDVAVLRGDRHLFAPPKDHGADIAVDDALHRRGLDAGLVDDILGEGDVHAEDFRGREQALGMFLKLVDAAVVDALALEHAGAVMQAVGQDMGLGVAPFDHMAVVPEVALARIEGEDVGHRGSLRPCPGRGFSLVIARGYGPFPVIIAPAWGMQTRHRE